MPATARVPYVSGYIANTGVLQSEERDLFNINDKPLNVQRMCARLLLTATADLSNERWFEGGENINAVGGANAARINTLLGLYQTNKLKIQDHNGFAIVKDFTSWAGVFDVGPMSWTFNRTLAPGDRYIVMLKDSPGVNYLPCVSLIGTREETFRW
jgi:hypothetical protein